MESDSKNKNKNENENENEKSTSKKEKNKIETKIKITKKSLEEFTDKDIINRNEKESRELIESFAQTETEMKEFYNEMAASAHPEEYRDEVERQLRSFRRASANIAKAYSHCLEISDELAARWTDLVRGKNRKILPAPPANSVIDLEELKKNHFASGINIYKILLICFIGSFAGVIIELLWCLFTRGYLESRSGLVYGPFNLLYGMGAVALSLALYRFRNRGKWVSFIGGFIVGSVVEYACSWAQELVFGSRSWDYSHMPFNINGRICLLYSIFWGILGIVWMKAIYPWMAKFILQIPNKIGKALTWAITIFFIFNSVVTVVAVHRWSERIENIEPSNSFWEFVDTRFTDERMERIFANMEFKNK